MRFRSRLVRSTVAAASLGAFALVGCAESNEPSDGDIDELNSDLGDDTDAGEDTDTAM